MHHKYDYKVHNYGKFITGLLHESVLFDNDRAIEQGAQRRMLEKAIAWL